MNELLEYITLSYGKHILSYKKQDRAEDQDQSS